MTTNVDIMQEIPVKIGKNIFHMDSEQLIASMTHQVIHKNNLLFNSDEFGIIFDVTKIEVTNFLKKYISNNFESFDFFNNWMIEFDNYQLEKNKYFCKDLLITFPDRTQFSVRFLDILSLKNKIEEKDENEIDDEDPMLKDPTLMINWVNENLDWDDISEYAEFVKTSRQESTRNKNFIKAEKKITEWQKQLSIFDFISKGDMIISNDDDED